MEKQEAFERALTAMRQQGRPSIRYEDDTGYPVCAYRSGELRCAIGALIDDDHYDPAWDEVEQSVVGLQKTGQLDFLGLDIEFMLDMQRELHDVPSVWEPAEFLRKVEEGADRFADRWDLTIPT